MHLGIEQNTGLVYEGLGAPELPTIPTPHITQAKLIEQDSTWKSLPQGLAMTPMAWVFREDSFDPVTRVRRGRLYEARPGQSQPSAQRVGLHPHEDPMLRPVGGGGRIDKTLYTYTACNPLLLLSNQGQGMTLALGSDRAASAWRIIQTEVLANGCVLVTLRALSAFAILPEVAYDRIAEPHRHEVRSAILRVVDSAFRESPTSVVDHCRAALTVLLSRWLVEQGHDDSILSLDLGDLAKKIDTAPYDMGCPSRVAQVIARLHVRGKPNEQYSKGLRQPAEGDAELAIHAVGLALRDFGWALQ